MAKHEADNSEALTKQGEPRQRKAGGGRKKTLGVGFESVVKADVPKEFEERFDALAKHFDDHFPGLKIQKADLTRRGFITQLEEMERKVFGIPITDEMRSKMFTVLGEFTRPSQKSYPVRVSNAGPWKNMENDDTQWQTESEILDWRNDDLMWRVNSDPDNGMCLIDMDILPDDLIQFRPGLQPENGDVVLAIGHDVKGQSFVTVKIFHANGVRWRGQPVIELRSANGATPPIQVFPYNIEIEGVAVNVIRRGLRRRKNVFMGKSKQ